MTNKTNIELYRRSLKDKINLDSIFAVGSRGELLKLPADVLFQWQWMVLVMDHFQLDSHLCWIWESETGAGSEIEDFLKKNIWSTV